jgi:hypothetical protein
MPDPSNDAPGLTVVLSCHGPGSDASTFRPRRDESQWWQRRDALVRCVAAFLGGPSLEGAGGGQVTYHSSSWRRLVLLFDEDWARMEFEYDDNTCSEEKNEDNSRMTVGPRQNFVPTEQSVITLFQKTAASSPGTTVTVGKLRGILRLALHTTTVTSSSRLGHRLPSTLDGKRTILEYLQCTCSIEFLRQYGLNSSTAALTRKS